MFREITTQNDFDQSFPTEDSQINEGLPLSLKFVIYGNWFYVANGWSVIIFFILMKFIFNKQISLIFYLVMAFPLLLLSSLTIIISSNLLRKSNIVLSTSLVMMNYFYFDLINDWVISAFLGVMIPSGELYILVVILFLISTSMLIVQLFLLIFSSSLKIYFLQKHQYIRPRILRNFGFLSILGGFPLGLLYAYYFGEIIYN